MREGRVRIVWNRSPLHASINAYQLRAALEAAGFTIDPRFGLNDGLTVTSTEDADYAEVSLRNVADRTPMTRAPLSSVEGWDDAFAREVDLSHDLIDAEGAVPVSSPVRRTEAFGPPSSG